MPAFKEVVAKNGPAVGVICAAIIAATWLMILRPSRGARTVTSAYYDDLGAERLFTDSPDKKPPIDAPSGHQGVGAAVFACGDCADSGSHFIAYLEKFTDEFKVALKKGIPSPDLFVAGHLVRAVEGDEWIPRQSPRGEQLVQLALQRCGRHALQTCNP